MAIVTGGGRGIGRAICIAFAEAGASVAVNYRRDDAAAADVVNEIADAGGVARPYRASMDSTADVDGLVDAVRSELGPIDIVVNCAGTASRGHSVIDTDPAELPRLLAVNAFGPHRLAQLTLPDMRANGLGHIVMISSIATQTMGANGAPYNMAKAAMEALAFTLAAEEKPHGIRVNVVAPGLVSTEMGRRMTHTLRGVTDMTDLDIGSPFGHVCTPEEVASVVLFLVSPAAGYVTGQRLAVDGGVERSGGPMCRLTPTATGVDLS